MEATEKKERMLFIHESPNGDKISSTMEKRSFVSDNMTSTSEVHHMTSQNDGNVNWGNSLTRGPVNAMTDLKQLDTNHNRMKQITHFPNVQTLDRNYSTSSNVYGTSSIRRHQSEGGEIRANTLGRDVATAQIRGHVIPPPPPVRSVHSIVPAPPLRGVETATAEVRRRNENGFHTERMQHTVTLKEGGRCTCCPYGYHVDLDFVNFCENLTDGAYLHKLKRIQREKRKLRKSMEVFLQQQDDREVETSPPPDVVQNVNVQATAFLKNIEQQNNASNKVLEEIDSSVDATLQSIDTMMYTTKVHSQLVNSDSEGTSSSLSPPSTMKFNTFPKLRGPDIQQEIEQFNTSLEYTGRTDSQSSLSSISTMASEFSPGYTQTTTSNVMNESSYSKITHITSEQLAHTMATHLPSDDGAASPQSTTTSISKASLQAIREAMATSLQRMKDLEEQVKAIPVLQVRISVLKEEKRMLMLQQRAKTQKLNTRTIGIGDKNVYEDDSSLIVVSPRSPKSPPATLPKPKVKTKAVGDHSVLEAYLIQPDLPPSFTLHDNEKLVSETLVLERDHYQTVYAPFQTRGPKPQTRTIGIGDANVFDDSGLRIHEKELRTVIIGQQNIGKRNVGVDCRVPTRDVGVCFALDEEKPSMRSVGVNVDTGSLISSFSFKADEMRSALREVLHKSVRSVGTTCDFRPERIDAGVQYSSFSLRSIGVGDESIDVLIREPVATKSIGCEALPQLINKSSNTDYGWRLDSSTNTPKLFTENKLCMTEHVRQGNKTTMTDEKRMYTEPTQTEQRVFFSLNQIKNSANNTEEKRTRTTAMNTEVKELTNEEFDFQITFKSQGCNTFDKSSNTEPIRVRDTGCSDDRVDSFVCSFEDDEPTMEETTEEVTYVTQTQIMQGKQSSEAKGQTVQRVYKTDFGEDRNAMTKELLEKGVVEIPSSSVIVREYSSKSSSSVGSEGSHDTKGAKSFGSGGSRDMDRFKLDLSRSNVSSSDGQIVRTTKDVKRTGENTEEVVEKKISSQGGNTYNITTITTRRNLRDGGTEIISQDESVVSGDDRLLEMLTASSGAELSSSQELTSSDSESQMYTARVIRSGIDSGSGDRSALLMPELEQLAKEGYSTSSRTSPGSSKGSVMISSLTSQSSQGSSRGSDMTSSMTSSQESSKGEMTSSQISQGSSGFGTGSEDQEEVHVVTETYSLRDIGGQSYYEKYFKSGGDQDSGSSRTVKTTYTSEGRVIEPSPSLLKSCMKKSKTETVNKRGITFAENVTGGTGEETSEDNASDDESTTSYDEGSYDGREGSITYQCQDDEAIRQGAPGAKMFDQNIRETFELNSEVHIACETLAKYLEDSTEVQTKQLNASVNVIQQEWFKIASHKLSDCNQVEDYLSSFNEISPRCLEYIVNLQDANGNTAIHYAVSHCNFDIVNLLLDTGVMDLNKQNKAGYTATMLATLAYPQTESQQEVIKRLFCMGDVNAKASKDGQTALMLAVSQGRTEMVEMLLESGAEVNAQDNEGSTAVMCACEHGHTNIVKLLLAYPDCDANIADNDNCTPLKIAMDAGHKDIGVLLYAHLNFKQSQSSPALVRKKKHSSSSLTSPTAR